MTLGQRATSLLPGRRAGEQASWRRKRASPARPMTRVSLMGDGAERPSSTVRAGHACADPGFQSFHELLVRERWGPAVGAGRPGPEDERIRLHVLDDVFAATAAAIPFRVFHLLADPAPSSGLPTAWTPVQGARSLRQERNHQPCSSPDDTSGTAAWARRGRPFRGRREVDEGFSDPSAWEIGPDGN